MIINEEKSKKYNKVAAIALAGLMAIGGGIKISDCFVSKVVAETISVEQQEEHLFEGEKTQEERDYWYLKNINEADLSLFNQDFLDFYHNGKIYVEGQDEPFKVSGLAVISKDTENGIEYHVVSYSDMNHDIFTGIDLSNFERDYLLDFMNSNCFYDFYLCCVNNNCIDNNEAHISEENKETILSSLEGYDKTMHDKTPETFYLRKR